LGPPAFGGRYVRQLAARSALRKKQVFCLVCGFAALPTIARPLNSLSSFGVLFWRLGGCGSMQAGGLKPLFAFYVEKRC